MGKIIDRIRDRERRRDGRRVTEQERERIRLMQQAYESAWFWRLVEKLRARAKRQSEFTDRYL